ncbi:MAG: 2-amino-4-hydroxy-6-hydroxymethyldihydropteridine diphosphokinase [Candidatus Midichloria sp.]|nr:MAG: 2-amino-4-hydroxy-6-hydroxymethyldihydropteridine diphosphokinase [Candidatus Midichloria sp.]
MEDKIVYQYLLGLGSNLGYRKNNLERAINELSQILFDIKQSSLYESEAMLTKNAPKGWDMHYLNMCLTGCSSLKPTDIFPIFQKIEEKIGKGIHNKRWSPRSIDIDILLVDSLLIKQDNLQIPHPAMLLRDFVLIPAIEIWPDAKHPETGEVLKNIKPKIITNTKKYAD